MFLIILVPSPFPRCVYALRLTEITDIVFLRDSLDPFLVLETRFDQFKNIFVFRL